MVFKLFCGISNFYKCKCEKIQIISLFMWRHTQKMCLQAVESFWPVLMGFRDPLVKAQIVESLQALLQSTVVQTFSEKLNKNENPLIKFPTVSLDLVDCMKTKNP